MRITAYIPTEVEIVGIRVIYRDLDPLVVPEGCPRGFPGLSEDGRTFGYVLSLDAELMRVVDWPAVRVVVELGDAFAELLGPDGEVLATRDDWEGPEEIRADGTVSPAGYSSPWRSAWLDGEGWTWLPRKAGDVSVTP